MVVVTFTGPTRFIAPLLLPGRQFTPGAGMLRLTPGTWLIPPALAASGLTTKAGVVRTDPRCFTDLRDIELFLAPQGACGWTRRSLHDPCQLCGAMSRQ